MSYKKGHNNGFLLGMKFGAGMAEAQYLSAVQHSIDDETYKKDGFKTAEEFITDGQRFTSYDVFRKRSAVLKQLGVELTGTLLDAGFTWNRMRAIENLLPENARNKDLLQINGKEVSIQNKELLATEIKLLQERHASAQKAEKAAKKDLDRLKTEFDKGDSPAKKRLAELEAIAGVPDTPEKVIAGFERIDKAFSDLETIIRVFCWKDAKKLIMDDPALQAKVEGIQKQMQARVEQLIKDWDDEMTI